MITYLPPHQNNTYGKKSGEKYSLSHLQLLLFLKAEEKMLFLLSKQNDHL